VYKPLGRTSWLPGVIVASLLIVGAWGYFLVQGVRDPLGGINSLWPLFGIANQLLAAIALCVATTILIKMHRAKYMWITCLPLAWLLVVTYTAAWQKIFSPVPRIGFLAQARTLQAALDTGSVPAAQVAETTARIFNERLDAVVCGIFLVLVTTILIDSIRVWAGILRGTREAKVLESPFVISRLRPEEI
jgi:carbon starvation protein